MESSKADPIQEENLASIRRKNTLLIAILFSFIVSLSLIVGGSIVYLVFNHDSASTNPRFRDPALSEFCSVAESRLGCIFSLSSYNTQNMLFSDPIHVYTFALESAVERLSRADSFLSDSNCSASLQAAAGRIERALAVVRVDPGNETRVFGERGGMAELIVEAAEELGSRSCSETTAGLTWVHRIELLLRYCRDYLLQCDLVDRRFRFHAILRGPEMSRNTILRLLVDSGIVFGLQYFYIAFLFILILLRCNICYIGGCCRRV